MSGTSSLSRELLELARGSDSPAVPVVAHLLAAAREAGASDLHVDPGPEAYALRLRLDGVLAEAARLPRDAVPTLVARLKVLAQLPTYVVDRPQDGRIPGSAVDAAGDLRLAVLPTIHGEKAVVRFFSGQGALPTLGGLGLPEATREALKRLVLAPQGVVVLCGPAGAGKSTTIHAALRFVQERSGGTRSIVGIEDPVERVIPGITQAQVDPAAGFGYPEALRAFLRQDPELIHLGEVRDAETAGVCIEAGLTGHLVLTTLHAGSAAQVFSRLLEMGIEPHLVVSALAGVFAQRLLRGLCRECAAEDADLPARLRPRLTPEARPRRAQGCGACHGTGFRGRLPLAEHLLPSSALRRAVLARADEDALQAVQRESGGASLWDHAWSRLARGETAWREIERVLGPPPEA